MQTFRLWEAREESQYHDTMEKRTSTDALELGRNKIPLAQLSNSERQRVVSKIVQEMKSKYHKIVIYKNILQNYHEWSN